VIDIKADLEGALAGFKWEVIGLLLEDQRVIDVPSDSRAISAIFQQLVVERIKPLAEKYGCILEGGGGREYPDITLRDIPGIEGKIAIDIKTSRKKSPNTIGGFTQAHAFHHQYRGPKDGTRGVRFSEGISGVWAELLSDKQQFSPPAVAQHVLVIPAVDFYYIAFAPAEHGQQFFG